MTNSPTTRGVGIGRRFLHRTDGRGTVSQLLFLSERISILEGTWALWDGGNYFLFTVIVVFSVIFPAVKLLAALVLWYGVDDASPLLRRGRSELKSTLAVSMRALEVGMYYRSRDRFHQCDLLICPEELARYGNFDTRHYAEILEIGYRAAREKMPEIRDLLRRA